MGLVSGRSVSVAESHFLMKSSGGDGAADEDGGVEVPLTRNQAPCRTEREEVEDGGEIQPRSKDSRARGKASEVVGRRGRIEGDRRQTPWIEDGA